jgi:hypothetical protein
MNRFIYNSDVKSFSDKPVLKEIKGKLSKGALRDHNNYRIEKITMDMLGNDDYDPYRVLTKGGFIYSLDNETGNKAYEIASKELVKAKVIKTIDPYNKPSGSMRTSPADLVELDGEQYKTWGEAGYGIILAKTKSAIKKLLK